MLRDMIWNLFSQNWQQEGEDLLEEQLEYFEQLAAGVKQWPWLLVLKLAGGLQHDPPRWTATWQGVAFRWTRLQNNWNNDNQLRADHDLIFEITKISGNAYFLESLIFFVDINQTKSYQAQAREWHDPGWEIFVTFDDSGLTSRCHLHTLFYELLWWWWQLWR